MALPEEASEEQHAAQRERQRRLAVAGPAEIADLLLGGVPEQLPAGEHAARLRAAQDPETGLAPETAQDPETDPVPETARCRRRPRAARGRGREPGLQGTEIWLAIIWLSADLAGESDLLGYRPRAVPRPEPARSTP